MTQVDRHRVNRHREWMDGYWQERERHRIAGENASLGYATELREWLADNPIPRLADWMKHREKAPEMTEPQARDEWADDSERLTNWDQEAEQARAGDLAKLDRDSEQAAENVEMRRYLGVDIEQPTVAEVRAYNEASLLGAAMLTEEAHAALRTVRNEFSDVFHEQVGRAILDQATDGAPYDSQSVTEVLRERGQLSLGYDPEVAMHTVDGAEYGLGVWEHGAVPGDANALAQKIREAHRCDYLTEMGAGLQQDSRAALEAGADPSFAVAKYANKLVNVPRRIDLDLREIKDSASLDAVDIRKPVKVAQVASEATATPRLGLPARPATVNLRAVASA